MLTQHNFTVPDTLRFLEVKNTELTSKDVPVGGSCFISCFFTILFFQKAFLLKPWLSL